MMRKTRLVAVAVVAVAAMVVAPAAKAATPAPGYEQFKGCPTKTEIPIVISCLHAVIKGGHFQMGSKDVPIEKSINIRGGILSNGIIAANSEGGLEPVKQKVPGGVIGLTGLTWLLELLGSEALTLYATTELAGIPSLSEGIISLPIKVHLENSTLGKNCYVGSTTTPIKLNLTTGTTSPPGPNVPITGTAPEEEFDFEKFIFHLNNGNYVDNSFAAPGASGCVLTLFGFIPISINGLVNSQSGLPSPAGKNETQQLTDQETVAPKRVYPPLGF